MVFLPKKVFLVFKIFASPAGRMVSGKSMPGVFSVVYVWVSPSTLLLSVA